MADWTTGRGYATPDRNGPSLAEIARLEAEATARERDLAPRPRAKRKYRPRPDRGWYEGYRHYDAPRRVRAVQTEATELLAEIRHWEEVTPRNRAERRMRAAILRDLHHRVDSLPDR